MIPVGFFLAPDVDFLARTARCALRADYVAVSPETLWAPDLSPNRFHQRLQATRALRGTPVVAHTVALSVGSAVPPARHGGWLRALARDQACFDFAWLTAHLGFSAVDGIELHLPLPLPDTDEAARSVCSGLAALRTIVPVAGVENSALYVFPDGLCGDARLLSRICARDDRAAILLDLHNLWVTVRNTGLDPEQWLAQVPLHRVVEIHIGGGEDSAPGWLPGGATVYLDSHSDAVPEPVWSLLETVLPRCPALRGVTLERREGTVSDDGVDALEAELDRLRALCARDWT